MQTTLKNLGQCVVICLLAWQLLPPLALGLRSYSCLEGYGQCCSCMLSADDAAHF